MKDHTFTPDKKRTECKETAILAAIRASNRQQRKLVEKAKKIKAKKKITDFTSIGIETKGKWRFIKAVNACGETEAAVTDDQLKGLWGLLHMRFGRVCKCNPEENE